MDSVPELYESMIENIFTVKEQILELAKFNETEDEKEHHKELLWTIENLIKIATFYGLYSIE